MKKYRFITISAAIAALYVVLTFVANFLGLASGVIQCRLSEALCVLPFFTPAAVPGLFIGCFLSNFLTGCHILDVVFGSIATLLGALFTRKFKTFGIAFSLIGPIVSNTVIVPFVLKLVYGMEGGLWFFAMTVLAGEVISCGLLGIILGKYLTKHKKNIF